VKKDRLQRKNATFRVFPTHEGYFIACWIAGTGVGRDITEANAEELVRNTAKLVRVCDHLFGELRRIVEIRRREK
jgi:hypothetical protein